MNDKRTFKICEAVAIGLKYYYMGPRDKRKITDQERKEAKKITISSTWRKCRS